MPLISVIVPVYKAENYIERCVRSILSQTIKDIEVILVDDGSPDNSGTICDGFAKSDERVVVIHKKNEGVSIARNIGIDIAKGKYLAFVDADDWIEAEMYEKMLDIFNQYTVDFVRCNRIYSGWPGKQDGPPVGLQDRCLENGYYDGIRKEKEIYHRMFVTDKLNMGPICSTFLTVYKVDFLNRNKIRFEQGVKINEDLIFSAKVVYHAEAFFTWKMDIFIIGFIIRILYHILLIKINFSR